MIQVEGLTKDYGARRAIDNLTFHSEKGEILGFLGPNGAGKTTTMRILCGYMPPTSGSARVAGYDIIEQSLEVRKRVGYLPETVPLYSDMTVYEYLRYMADLRHLPDAVESVYEVLEIVHMTEREDSHISSLSKGMRQRIGLAQAIIHKPDVLILDEPTIGLDPAQIIEVRNLIREIGKEKTVLLSTHILSEAQQLCDRVLIINKGKIVAEDTPDRLQNRLAGSGRIILTVQGDEQGLEPILLKISGVHVVAPNGVGSYEIETISGQDPRSAIAREVVQGGYNLVELRAVGMSLEDIFMELTQDEPEPPSVEEDEPSDGKEEN